VHIKFIVATIPALAISPVCPTIKNEHKYIIGAKKLFAPIAEKANSKAVE
jgi:hypothetical protein